MRIAEFSWSACEWRSISSETWKRIFPARKSELDRGRGKTFAFSQRRGYRYIILPGVPPSRNGDISPNRVYRVSRCTRNNIKRSPLYVLPNLFRSSVYCFSIRSARYWESSAIRQVVKDFDAKLELCLCIPTYINVRSQ